MVSIDEPTPQVMLVTHPLVLAVLVAGACAAIGVAAFLAWAVLSGAA